VVVELLPQAQRENAKIIASSKAMNFFIELSSVFSF
jgi:hypothetical protein